VRCAGQRVLGTRPFLHHASLRPHELLHAYTAQIGDPPLFFKEGIARVLGCSNVPYGDPIVRSRSIVQVLETDAMKRQEIEQFYETYVQAGAFTRFLIDRYGKASYLAFYRSVRDNASLAEIRAGFARAFSVSLDQAVEAWITSPRQGTVDICLWLAECAEPAMDMTGARVTVKPSCSALSNPASDRYAIRVLNVPARSAIRLTARPSAGVVHQIYRCGHNTPGMEIPNYAFLLGMRPEARKVLWTDIDAGRYWWAIEPTFEGGATSVEITAEFNSSLFSGAGKIYDVPDKTDSISICRDRLACSSGPCAGEYRFRAQERAKVVPEVVRVSFNDNYDIKCLGRPDRLTLCDISKPSSPSCTDAKMPCTLGVKEIDMAVTAGGEYSASWQQQAGKDSCFSLRFLPPGS
jgi:hypothetical protein